MRIDESFEVRAPREVVWRSLQNVPAVSRCLPGAQLDDVADPGRYSGRMTVRLGPITLGFEGEATLASDPEAWAATITGRGVDRRGGSRADVSVQYTLAATGDGTVVAIAVDLALAGPAAQFGRIGLIQELARRLIAEFATCLESTLQGAVPD